MLVATLRDTNRCCSAWAESEQEWRDNLGRKMPLYFFDIYSHNETIHSSGAELANDKEAWGQALQALCDTTQEFTNPPKPGMTCRIEVHCGVGNPVFTLDFAASTHRH